MFELHLFVENEFCNNTFLENIWLNSKKRILNVYVKYFIVKLYDKYKLEKKKKLDNGDQI